MKLFGSVVRWFRRRFMVPTAEHSSVSENASSSEARTVHYVVTLAKIDLSNRLGISRESIKVLAVRRVDWPDTSLGHPEPGKVYAQVITPGFLIKLEAGGKLCEYHSDYTRVVFAGCKTTS